MSKEQGTFHWGHEALHLEIVLDADGSPRLTHLGLPGEVQRIPGASLPLVEVTAAGHGRGWSGNRLVGTDLGGRLRHRTHPGDPRRRLAHTDRAPPRSGNRTGR
ncbi:hypothetical protein SAFG77S_10056 [Streptomyces afghaniensis]